jgi:hypothetical protein
VCVCLVSASFGHDKVGVSLLCLRCDVVREVANTIHPMIQMEEDTPSNHTDSKIPILDLKCWIGADGQIWFHHYEKPMASKMVLPARSALPMTQKRNIHINECVRRLRNCKPEMEWEKKREFVQDYVVRLFHGGYTEQFRHNIVKQAVARYDGMVVADREGTHPLYREGCTGIHRPAQNRSGTAQLQ